MTTNTNTRTPARFFASATPVPGTGRYSITDRTDGTNVALVKGRQAARDHAAALTAIDPAPRDDNDTLALNLRDTKKAAKAARKAKAEPKAEATKAPAARTSHADCAHASSKLARAICRRERAKADA